VKIQPASPVLLTAPDTTTLLSANVSGSANGVTFQWCKTKGLGEVRFSNPTDQATFASFDIATLVDADVYEITVTATRGNASAEDSVIVAVGLNPDPAGVFSATGISNLVNVTTPDKNVNTTKFLSIISNDEAGARAYYEAIDPFHKKTTWTDWLRENGMLAPDGRSVEAGNVTVAAYFNAVDLGFGRRMLMSQNRRAWSVSNYDTAEDAVNDSDPIAAVTMEYAPPDQDPSGAPFTKFYVFKFRGGRNGARDISADLDGGGEKYVPGLCIVCHGGHYPPVDNQGNVNAHFLPFDLNALDYSCDRGFRRSDLEGEFHKLNQGVLEIEAGTATSPANKDRNGNYMTTLITLIEGWYGSDFVVPAPEDLPNHTQNSEFVPLGWSDTAAHAFLYQNVEARSCRNCHSTRDSGSLAFGTFADFDSLKGLYPFFVFGGANLANTPITPAVPGTTMPHARKTFQRFWLSTTPQQPVILRNYLQNLPPF
jgi:hypothetical protein